MSRLAAIRRGRSVGAKIPGGRVVPGEYFLVSTKLDTFCYPTVQMHHAMCRRFDTIPECDRWTEGRMDGQTDGIAVASTALAIRALQRAVKTTMIIRKTAVKGMKTNKNCIVFRKHG